MPSWEHTEVRNGEWFTREQSLDNFFDLDNDERTLEQTRLDAITEDAARAIASGSDDVASAIFRTARTLLGMDAYETLAQAHDNARRLAAELNTANPHSPRRHQERSAYRPTTRRGTARGEQRRGGPAPSPTTTRDERRHEMDIRQFAQNDNEAMHVLCGWATGTGADAYADWLDQFRVNDLPQAVINGIVRGDHSAQYWMQDDDGDEDVTITAAALADYGGGSVAMTWYADDEGNVYGVQDPGNLFRIPADHVEAAPQVTDYQPITDEADD